MTTLVVGLGSNHGDDQAGWLVTEMLKELRSDSDSFISRRGRVPLDLLDWLDGVEILHICDACEISQVDKPSGSTRMLEYLRGQNGRLADSTAPENTVTAARIRTRGSHDFELPAVLQLAEQLGKLPDHVFLWAIPGSRFRPGDEISSETRLAVRIAAEQLLHAIRGNSACER